MVTLTMYMRIYSNHFFSSGLDGGGVGGARKPDVGVSTGRCENDVMPYTTQATPMIPRTISQAGMCVPSRPASVGSSAMPENPASNRPTMMKIIPAQAGVGGVYRVPQALQIRSMVKAGMK